MTARMIGCVLLAAAGAMAGNARLSAVRRRIRFLEDMDGALGIVQGRLEALLSPLPDVFEFLAVEGAVSVRGFFTCLILGQGERPLSSVWDSALDSLALPETERRLLSPLGRILGRYDAGRQSAEITLVRDGLRRLSSELREELRTRGRSYVGLGASAGAMLALMLL